MTSPRHRSHPRPIDWSRVREVLGGYPSNYLAYGTVGHLDITPLYARVEDGDVLVEVTLVPAGDEIVARLDLDTVDGGCGYHPISYGQRVIVGFPGGANGDPVIVGRCSDAAWPFPSSVAGADFTGPAPPMMVFEKTATGHVYAVETGTGGDLLLHSGASAQIRAGPGQQVLVSGRTHIGSSAQFLTPVIPPRVGPDGNVIPGAQAQGYVPLPNTNTTIPPPLDANAMPLPADGLVRIKDSVQSNQTIDNAFFQALITLWASVSALVGYVNGLVPGTAPPPGLPPSQLTALPASGSQNTCSDA